MNCEGWRIEIAAFLDGSSDPTMISRVRGHLDSCSSCLEFYREQSQLNALLGSEDLQLEPPEYLWRRIESRMGQPQEAPAFPTFLARFFGFWQAPRLRYALVSSLLILVVSWSLLQFKSRHDADQALLARIDAYQMSVVPGNPFLSGLKEAPPPDNPFLNFTTASSNPFQSTGSRQ